MPCRCLGPLAQSCFLELNTIALESTPCDDLLTVLSSLPDGLHGGRDLKCPKLNSCSTPNPQSTVFPVSVKVTSFLPVSQARYQGVSLYSSLSPPTIPSISNQRSPRWLCHIGSHLTISPPATPSVLGESTAVSHPGCGRSLPAGLPASVLCTQPGGSFGHSPTKCRCQPICHLLGKHLLNECTRILSQESSFTSLCLACG